MDVNSLCQNAILIRHCLLSMTMKAVWYSPYYHYNQGKVELGRNPCIVLPLLLVLSSLLYFNHFVHLFTHSARSKSTRICYLVPAWSFIAQFQVSANHAATAGQASSASRLVHHILSNQSRSIAAYLYIYTPCWQPSWP